MVAAINGHALGGGLEIALACHARIALDDARLKLGQPEVKLGLLPGGGGTVRLPRLVGIQQALQICAEGNDIAPAKALAMGLLTELAKDRDDLLAQAARLDRRQPEGAAALGPAEVPLPGRRFARAARWRRCWRSRRRSRRPRAGATTRR